MAQTTKSDCFDHSRSISRAVSQSSQLKYQRRSHSICGFGLELLEYLLRLRLRGAHVADT
jgi:hypothetical protein